MSTTFKNNFEYRNFLTKNGTKIMQINNNNVLKTTNCNVLNNNSYRLKNTPYLYNGLIDSNKPYGYTESDLKTFYINKQVTENTMYNMKFFLNKNPN
tara:strand:- start:2510 stop:2800 length:291 start_codon:yes stop_codon:yes gene_type:complete